MSTLVRAFLLSEKKSERGEINRVRFRRLSEHAAAAEEPRAAAVTCLTCPGFFPPVALSVSRSPLLPSFLSLYPPSLARSLDLSLSSPPTRRRRERRLSVAALVPIWRVRMCRVMYRYLHNPSADVYEDSRKKSRKERKWNQLELVIPVKFPSAIISFVCFFYYLLCCFLLVSATFRFLFGLQVTVGTESRKHPQIRAHSDTAAVLGTSLRRGHMMVTVAQEGGFFFICVCVCV